MTIRMGDFENIVVEHMKSQPYEVNCSMCGRALEHTKTIDEDLDIIVTVLPCECANETNT